MPRILIADGQPSAGQAELARAGGASNAVLFTDTVQLNLPGATCVAVNIADGEPLPAGASIGDFDGVILTGSSLHIYERSPPVQRQIDFARAVFATPMPVWGSCWGVQLAAVALGGSVRRNPNGREFGVARAITLTPAGGRHPMLAGRPAVFDALCSHLDEIDTLPPGAEVLAGNAVSAVQALCAPTPGGGAFHGAQYHPEMTLGVVAALIGLRAGPLAAEGFGADEDGLRAFADDLRALDAAPGRGDLAWRYGIGPEILDPARRTLEIGAWLRAGVAVAA